MYVIDTYNLLHASALRGGPAPTSVLSLCRLLASTGTRATLVLDGRPKPDEPSANEFPSLTLVYSGAGIPADTVIGQIVERHPQRKKLTVVTDDRAVALHASSRLASAIGCDAFLERLFSGRSGAGPALPPKKLTGSPTSGETQHWLKEFGLTAPPNEPTKPAPPADDDIDGIDIESLLGPRGEDKK
jgi:hypothetical protein